MKTTYATILLGLFGCSGNPYEEQIVKHFETNAKVVPIIEVVTIDTTASITSYVDYWKESINVRREQNREFYGERYDYYKKELEKDRERIKSDLKKYKKVYRDSSWTYKNFIEYKNKLDSVNISTDPVFETYNELINSKSEFEYLTVKYKLEKNGPTLIGNFVVENKTNLDPTPFTLDKFIKDTYLDKIRIPKAEKYLKENL